ncbi:hypothetical protein BGW80DRAFT_276586 [Lactifluus volemus]|nr:hypothetical protein BGW80DRAFT_276586 [Lactifluus volemus]
MDQPEHEDIPWLNARLSDHAQGLSDIYDRICSTIRQFQEDNAELQNRVQELEQHDPSTELQRLREENADLRAKLAAATTTMSEITWERDALLLKVHTIKQVLEKARSPRPMTDRKIARYEFFRGITSGGDVHSNPDPGPSASQRAAPTTEFSSPTRTDVSSSPMTDVTVMHDEFGRTLRPSESTSGSSNSQPSQPLSTHSSATLTDNHPRSREAPTTSLGAPFVDARTAASASASTSTPPTLHAGTVRADLNGSPVRHPPSAVHLASLNVSPGMMSEGLSVQYDDTSRSGPVGVATTIQKWRIHFGRPPNSATVAALAKPVTTGTLVQKLELDGEAIRSIEGLSSIPAGSLRFYISDPFGLAFLYDPILLESPETTYLVEWGEVTANQNSKTYITNATEKHTELHTFIYAQRKDTWHYIGQQRWRPVGIKSIWPALAVPAQRALAARRAQNVDPVEIAQGLRRGKLEQLTVELEQVSRGVPNAAESALIRKLSD